MKVKGRFLDDLQAGSPIAQGNQFLPAGGIAIVNQRQLFGTGEDAVAVSLVLDCQFSVVVTAVGILLRLEQTAELLYILVVLTSVVEQFGQALVVLDGEIVRPHPICPSTLASLVGRGNK